MARKSLIQREKKRQRLEQKYHLIRRSSKKEIKKVPSLSDKWEIHGKLQSSPRNSAPTRLHRRCFRPEDRELTIETLGYLDTYFVKWFMHVCYQVQQDQVGKDQTIPSCFY
uniref:Ribosomal protein S14 n=2 Tax=Delphinieae TaxID=1463140 RepID=A0A023HNA1_9MAGN|nr:ribosomal protein S14 [Gymnaconitum gymnandrum]AGN73978.1 ribosomal protein S14 [Aconitum barbatum var. puberulum]ANJ04471.1 ribosomal protein S14 [Gymnaconitum gymnandrum]ANJ04554.1 ribosomal protein S14 [Aconitum barbatum var. puberulum]